MTNLIHTCFILQYVYYNPLHISSIICTSYGGWVVLMQHLVSSLSVSDRPVHRLRGNWVPHFPLNLCTGRPIKADSHITCRAHTVPLPCRAAKGLECVFPIWFTQCGLVWFTLAMPCPCHPRQCHFSQGHGTAWPSRESLWANCPCSASSGHHAELQEVLSKAYQFQMQVASVKPNTVYHGRGKEW